MASLPLINHHHVSLLYALQSTTANSPKVFNDSPSSMAPLPHSLLSHQHPNIQSAPPKSYGKVSERSTAHEETGDLKQESQLNFQAWRLGVETNTLRSWTVVPPECVEYVKSYMVGSGSQYVKDSYMVAKESMAYINSVKLSGDGKDAWVFDVDETLLSSLPFFAGHQYGGEGMDDDAFIKWADLAEAPPLPASRSFYAHLLQLGIKIFLLTGRYDYERNATEKNLARAGYHSWEALLLRDPEDYEKSAMIYKSERRLKIEQDGFRIVGNSGDQWSDLTGYAVGNRTFKMPNPMYWVA
jgi:acid phosphatase